MGIAVEGRVTPETGIEQQGHRSIADKVHLHFSAETPVATDDPEFLKVPMESMVDRSGHFGGARRGARRDGSLCGKSWQGG